MSTLSARIKATLELELSVKDPGHFPCFGSDWKQFAKEYLCYNFLRKVEPFANKEEVPRKVLRDSLTTFAEAEHRCLLVNRYGSTYSCIDPVEHAYFTEAFRLATLWINRVLCDVWPDLDGVRFTGGATRRTTRAWSHPALKWAGHGEFGNLSITQAALDFVNDNDLSWVFPRGLDIIEDSRFDFVAKTAKAVRFMAMENEGNQLVQSLLGDAIRGALMKVGINLDDQRPNQQLAYLGSVFRTRATLDQTSASDCIAMFLLRMLPRRWQGWINAARCETISVQGSRYRLQKIATMGNGFIFELQSLIFAAFAHACTALSGGRECDIAVFGDDIVVSTPVATMLMRTLEYYGLIPNMEKSYWGDVPFRESCGKHYYAGHDVTPFYVKAPLGPLHTLFRAINSLREWEARTGIRIPRTIGALVDEIARKDRRIVPRSYSNTSGLWYPEKGCRFPVRVVRHGELMGSFKAWCDKSEDIGDRLDDSVKLLDWLRHPPTPLLPDGVWACFTPSVRRLMLPGVPREQRVYSRGARSGDCAAWRNREIPWADIV